MAIYSDANQFSPTKIPLSEDLDSIYQSIGNILSTPYNTRLFLPEFGSQLENILFEPMDITTQDQLQDFIIQAIERWEPRVKLVYGKTGVVADYENHTYRVSLTFRVLGLDDNQFFKYVGILNQLVQP